MAEERKENTENCSTENKMTKEQAGHLGGAAPHECRGRECEECKHKSHNRK